MLIRDRLGFLNLCFRNNSDDVMQYSGILNLIGESIVCSILGGLQAAGVNAIAACVHESTYVEANSLKQKYKNNHGY